MKHKRLFVWRSFSGVLSLVVVLGLTACASVRQQTKPGDGLNTIQDISVVDQTDKTEIVVTAQKPLVYTSYQLTDPPRLIVDLAGASVGTFKDRLTIGKGAVTELLPIEGEKPSNVVRLEITLTDAVLSHVRADGEKLLIDVDKPVGAAVGETTAPVPTEAATEAAVPPPTVEEKPLPSGLSEPSLPPAKTVSKLKVEPDQDKITIILTADGILKPDAFMVEGNRLVVDLPDVTNGIRPNTISVKHKLLKRIRIGQHVKPKKVRVVLDLKTKVTFAVDQSGKQFAITVSAVPTTAEPVPAASEMKSKETPEEKTPTPEASVEKPRKKTVEKPKEKIAEREKAEPSPMIPEPAPSVLVEPSKREEPALQKKYVGRKVSLDFQDADISNVLRLLADVSGLNIVISDDVKGKVTLKLINVPWDQALDIVLKMNNLGQVREGTIIRVATVASITKQQDDEARAKETKVRAEDLVTKVVYVNYAKAEDLVETLKKNLSPRGDITIDKRTNTMIVKDVNKQVMEVVSLVKTLDTRTPQVQIEARIVQADTSFAQSLGIQWGVGFSHIGSNNISQIQGVNSGAPSQPGFGSFAPDFSVNLPGTVSGLSAVPAIGFNFGRFTDNPINLDLRISAGELNGLTKTISSPKVTTLDNVKAKIEQGESIPFQTTSQTGTQTTFVDANLTLEVTPHITTDRSIIMKVKAARNSIGSFSGPAGPSIAKREATTEVLVKDGETTVIGGIFVDENKNTETGIPLLSRIPILGWLFKNETKTDTKNELLIFLTPKIVKD
ncbi:MAG: type IV pilus secretin PilQ [Nitrospirae bacterium]|nr:type IV pilus secretin PilQ [Nitrospirota bacterium]